MSVPQPPVYIYGLSDPTTGELRYVGKSTDPQRRLQGHINTSKYRRFYSERWIHSLIKQGLLPELFVIETCTPDTWQDAERFWISYFRFVGCNLANHSEGGDGVTMTPEVRRKIADRQRQVKWSAERREAQRQRMIGKPARLGTKNKKPLPKKGQAGFEYATRSDAPTFLIFSPSGDTFVCNNLSRFCKYLGLDYRSLRCVACGQNHQTKGWVVYTIR